MAENDDTSSTNQDKGLDPTRRRFIKNTGIALGGIAGGSILGGAFTNQYLSEDSESAETDGKVSLQEARTFFSRADDFQTLAAATERIYPEDDHGPGAIELGVPYFIDKQLAGGWGTNNEDYTKGPFSPLKSDTHGLQSKMNRGEMFLTGIRRVQAISQKEHGDHFFNLEAEAQDAILENFESGDVEVRGMRSDTFFSLLRHTTLEGVYADPVYSGNRNMQGWKMIEYPGPRMGWGNDIEKEDFMTMDPKGLRDYQGGGVSGKDIG